MASSNKPPLPDLETLNASFTSFLDSLIPSTFVSSLPPPSSSTTNATASSSSSNPFQVVERGNVSKQTLSTQRPLTVDDVMADARKKQAERRALEIAKSKAAAGTSTSAASLTLQKKLAAFQAANGSSSSSSSSVNGKGKGKATGGDSKAGGSIEDGNDSEEEEEESRTKSLGKKAGKVSLGKKVKGDMFSSGKKKKKKANEDPGVMAVESEGKTEQEPEKEKAKTISIKIEAKPNQPHPKGLMSPPSIKQLPIATASSDIKPPPAPTTASIPSSKSSIPSTFTFGSLSTSKPKKVAAPLNISNLPSATNRLLPTPLSPISSIASSSNTTAASFISASLAVKRSADEADLDGDVQDSGSHQGGNEDEDPALRGLHGKERKRMKKKLKKARDAAASGLQGGEGIQVEEGD